MSMKLKLNTLMAEKTMEFIREELETSDKDYVTYGDVAEVLHIDPREVGKILLRLVEINTKNHDPLWSACVAYKHSNGEDQVAGMCGIGFWEAAVECGHSYTDAVKFMNKHRMLCKSEARAHRAKRKKNV